MKSFLIALALVVSPVAGLSLKADDSQIPSCGSVTVKTDIWQADNYQMRVEGYTQSTRNVDGCISKLRVEAWIDGTASGVSINEGFGSAVSVWYSKPVPSYRTWNAVGKHWMINFGAWLWNGYSHGSVALERPPTQPAPMPAECATDPAWSSECTPIVVDVARDGYHLTGIDDGVQFDLNGDGILERVSWTRPDSDDAFLAMDRNGNGRIDDGTELFGNTTPAYPGQPLLHALHGFDALKFLEGPDFGSSHSDAILDARDAMFSRLLLWTDTNHNGVSEPGELRSARDAGVVAIGTDYQLKKRTDRFGNRFRLKGRIAWTDAEEAVYDVILRVAPARE